MIMTKALVSNVTRRFKNFLRTQFTNFLNKVLNGVFVLGKPFQPSLMFDDKARAYPTESPFRYFTLL